MLIGTTVDYLKLSNLAVPSSYYLSNKCYYTV